MNNVFTFFWNSEALRDIWQFLRSCFSKSGQLIVSQPSIDSQLRDAQVINIYTFYLDYITYELTIFLSFFSCVFKI